MKQTYTSSATSINKDKIPALFSKWAKLGAFQPNTRNLDIGGGKYDNVTDMLHDYGCTNYVYDPYQECREAECAAILDMLATGTRFDTATLSNVLNVIDSVEARVDCLKMAHNALKPDGELFITIYEGNKSGRGRKTGQDQWQNNTSASWYLPEVVAVFGAVNVRWERGTIIATKEDQQ